MSDLVSRTQCNRLFPELYFSVNNKKFVCHYLFLMFPLLWNSVSCSICFTIFVSYKTWLYIMLFVTGQLETLFKEKSLLSDLKFIRPVLFLCVQKQFGAEKFLEVS